MSAILRAAGEAFDVDSFLRQTKLPVSNVVRRGDPKPSFRESGERTQIRSCVGITVSSATFESFGQQIEDAINFLDAFRDDIRVLQTFAGVERITLDFGVSRRNSVVETHRFPAALIRLVAAFNLGIDLSVYPPLDAVGSDKQ
jgi:hypothetical protein